MNKKILSIVVGALLTPTVSLAVGLGSIRTYSNLNEKLNAVIPVLSLRDKSRLNVSLASNAEFSQRGVRRSEDLDNLHFSTYQKGNRTYIRVSSKVPVTSPYLNFIVQLNSGDGTVSREYAVFLDPPSVSNKQAKQTKAPLLKTTRSAGQSRQTPSVAKQAVSVTERSAKKTSTRSSGTRGQVASGRYGPVRYGETLWSIASHTRPSSSVSIEQMLKAIRAANPRLSRGLQSGMVLKIPTLSGHKAYSGGYAPMPGRQQEKQPKIELTSIAPLAERSASQTKKQQKGEKKDSLASQLRKGYSKKDKAEKKKAQQQVKKKTKETKVVAKSKQPKAEDKPKVKQTKKIPPSVVGIADKKVPSSVEKKISKTVSKTKVAVSKPVSTGSKSAVKPALEETSKVTKSIAIEKKQQVISSIPKVKGEPPKATAGAQSAQLIKDEVDVKKTEAPAKEHLKDKVVEAKKSTLPEVKTKTTEPILATSAVAELPPSSIAAVDLSDKKTDVKTVVKKAIAIKDIADAEKADLTSKPSTETIADLSKQPPTIAEKKAVGEPVIKAIPRSKQSDKKKSIVAESTSNTVVTTEKAEKTAVLSTKEKTAEPEKPKEKSQPEVLPSKLVTPVERVTTTVAEAKAVPTTKSLSLLDQAKAAVANNLPVAGGAVGLLGLTLLLLRSRRKAKANKAETVVLLSDKDVDEVAETETSVTVAENAENEPDRTEVDENEAPLVSIQLEKDTQVVDDIPTETLIERQDELEATYKENDREEAINYRDDEAEELGEQGGTSIEEAESVANKDEELPKTTNWNYSFGGITPKEKLAKDEKATTDLVEESAEKEVDKSKVADNSSLLEKESEATFDEAEPSEDFDAMDFDDALLGLDDTLSENKGEKPTTTYLSDLAAKMKEEEESNKGEVTNKTVVKDEVDSPVDDDSSLVDSVEEPESAAQVKTTLTTDLTDGLTDTGEIDDESAFTLADSTDDFETAEEDVSTLTAEPADVAIEIDDEPAFTLADSADDFETVEEEVPTLTTDRSAEVTEVDTDPAFTLAEPASNVVESNTDTTISDSNLTEEATVEPFGFKLESEEESEKRYQQVQAESQSRVQEAEKAEIRAQQAVETLSENLGGIKQPELVLLDDDELNDEDDATVVEKEDKGNQEELVIEDATVTVPVAPVASGPGTSHLDGSSLMADAKADMKLDLAKSFLSIEQEQRGIDLLKEILEIGNKEQVLEAKKMLIDLEKKKIA